MLETGREETFVQDVHSNINNDSDLKNTINQSNSDKIDEKLLVIVKNNLKKVEKKK